MANIAAFTLTSPNTQTAAPFKIGYAFKKADVPSGTYLTLDIADYAVVPLRRWNDGSLKHAMLIGRADLTADVPEQITISTTLSAPGGTNLTAGDIETAAPSASVQCGAFGTVNLSALLATPQRTFISSPEMVECHYTSAVGADTSLYVWFHVRLFADGRMWVRAFAGNGYMEQATAAHTNEVRKDYVPTVQINGSTVWNNGGATYKHYPKTRWDITGWIGIDPEITPGHDTGYLNRTKLIPNYWKTPSQAEVDSWAAATKTVNVDGNWPFDAVTTYSPGEHMAYTGRMNEAGFQDMIGLLPSWEAMYCTSGAHPTMYKQVVHHARAANSYCIAYVDQATRNPVKLSSYANWTAEGDGGSGGGTMTAVRQDEVDDIMWEAAHAPSFGYLAYLITADYYYLETMQFGATIFYLSVSSGDGAGVNRDLLGQNRARAWGLRNIAQAAAILPVEITSLNTLFGDTRTWFANLISMRKTKYVTNAAATSWLGYESAYSNRIADGTAPNGEWVLDTAPWEHHFETQAIGMAYDIEPLADDTDLVDFRSYVQGAPIWILGGTGATEFNFGDAGTYTVLIRSSVASSTWEPPTYDQLIPTDPGQIYSDTHAIDTNPVPNPGTNTMGNGYNWAKSYIANLLPALAYAVDHGKTGADTCWNRILNATDASEFLVDADYANVPIWGVVPRSYSQPAIQYEVSGGEETATEGKSFRLGQLLPGAFHLGNRGLGVLASDIPSTGTHGASYLYDDLNLPADANYEVQGRIETPPVLGDFTPYEDGSFTYSGPDGIHTFTYRLYVGGVDRGTATETIEVGSVGPTTRNVAGANSIQASSSTSGAINIVRSVAGSHSTQVNSSTSGAITINYEPQTRYVAGRNTTQINYSTILPFASASEEKITFSLGRKVTRKLTDELSGLDD